MPENEVLKDGEIENITGVLADIPLLQDVSFKDLHKLVQVAVSTYRDYLASETDEEMVEKLCNKTGVWMTRYRAKLVLSLLTPIYAARQDKAKKEGYTQGVTDANKCEQIDVEKAVAEAVKAEKERTGKYLHSHYVLTEPCPEGGNRVVLHFSPKQWQSLQGKTEP